MFLTLKSLLLDDNLGIPAYFVYEFLTAAKKPKTWWLKTTEICCLTVLEGRSLKSGCQQGLVSSDVSSVHWHSLAFCVF